MQKKAQVVHGKKRISREVIGTSGCLGIICLTWTSISAEIIIFIGEGLHLPKMVQSACIRHGMVGKTHSLVIYYHTY